MAEAGISTLELVGVKRKVLVDYRRIVGADLVEEIHNLAAQIIGGFLVESVEECAERVAYLLTYSDEAESVARRGWEKVRENFLIPRLLRDELKLVPSMR